MIVHDPKPDGRAETIRLPGKGGHDRRTADEYAADLQAETDRTLRRSPSWQTGQPLADHRQRCDCPHTLAGCVERRPWPTIGELGGGRNLDSRQGRKLGPPDRGQS